MLISSRRTTHPGLPRQLGGKTLPANAGDVDSVPGSGRAPGEGNDNPPQHSSPGKPHGQRSLVGYRPRGRKSRCDLRTKQQRIYPNNGLCSPGGAGGAGRAGCLYIYKIVSKMEIQKHITFCVEKKRKNVKYICMFMYKRAWKHLLKTYNGLLLAE